MTTIRSLFDLALHFNNNSLRVEGRSKSLWIIEVTKKNKIGTGAQNTQAFKAVVGFKVKTSRTQMFLDTSLVIPNAELENVHPLLKRLYSKGMLIKAVDIPLAWRIRHVLVNWQKLTLNQDILSNRVKLQHLSTYLFNNEFPDL